MTRRMAGTSLTKRIPARLTVAGVAFLREWISKIIRIAAVSGIRSFDTRVSTCSCGNGKRGGSRPKATPVKNKRG